MKTIKKKLAIALSTVLGVSSVAQASDIEIYKNAVNEQQTTLMLLVDISGSMGMGHAMRDDYNIKAGNTAQYGNANDATNSYCKLNYSNYALGNWRAEMSANGATAQYVGNNVWLSTTPTTPDNYAREFCEIPLNVNLASANYINATTGNSWATDPVRGCPTVDKNGDGVADVRRCYSRITRVKDAIFDLLKGNPAKGIAPLAGDKAIGLSTISVRRSPSGLDPEIRGANYWGTIGAIRVPARRLDAVVGGKTHRQILLDAVGALELGGSTPTAQSFAETVAYMMGQNPSAHGESGYNFSSAPTKVANGSRYQSPDTLVNQKDKQCNGQGVYILTDGEPNNSNYPNQIMRLALGHTQSDPTFTCGIYDGLTNPTGNQSHRIWNCMYSFAETLNDPTKNPLGIRVKTAVVGFGRNYFNIPKYDKTKTKTENLALIKTNNEASRAARLGIRGEGGWYPGSSSEDVVNSINEFIEALNVDIPPVNVGSPTVPVDALNPSMIQNDAYFSQFQPTPDKNYQLWTGNLKKYRVDSSSKLKDKNNNDIYDTDGRIKDNVDFWSSGSPAGGVLSRLKLKEAGGKAQRKLLTNRVASGATFISGGSLRQVGLDYLTDATYKNDPNRGYLMALLGYNVEAENPTTITPTSLTTAAELRQIGAVMHSAPILLTSKGKIEVISGRIDSTNREDYVLFGTTQGLLHVVDAKTGEEKFAFVPNEMIENQKKAFLTTDKAIDGTDKMYYGIDGEWATYTDYVLTSSGELTVGTGNHGLNGKQYAYGGLRMGGRSYYALNLSDINNPKLMFHIDPATQKVYKDNSSKSYPELQYMAQSWSKPSLAWVNFDGKRKQVMFVGGGYDAGGDDGDARIGGVKGTYAGYEQDNYNQTNKKGAGVYMFDAENGDLLWWTSDNATATATGTSGAVSTKNVDLKYSVASQIRTIDRNNDGLTDHLYFGDLGGQVFRIDLNNFASTKTKFAKVQRILNKHKNDGTSPRFYDMPGFSIYDNQIGKKETFAVVSIGSGNRSEPLAEYNLGATSFDYDGMFNIYDKDVAKNDLYSDTYVYQTHTNTGSLPLVEITDAERTSGIISENSLKAPYDTTSGWYYQFKSGKVQTEKVMGVPIVMNKRLYVSSYDASKPGIAGNCGAGVKGESQVRNFCMPYGQCAVKDTNVKIAGVPNWNDNIDKAPPSNLGIGIQTLTTVDVKVPPTGTPSVPPVYTEDSSTNVCLATGELTVYNSNSSGNKTQVCLVPQRWFEKQSKI